MHYPVLCAEALEYLAIRPDGIYLDATAGLGGHTREIARRLTTGFVTANDRDTESLEFARANTLEFADRIRFRQGTFSDLQGIEKVNGLVADLGGLVRCLGRWSPKSLSVASPKQSPCP